MRKKSMAVAVAIALTAGTVMPQMTLADSFAQEDVQELEVQADFSEGETADDSGFDIEEADGDENAPDVEVDGEADFRLPKMERVIIAINRIIRHGLHRHILIWHQRMLVIIEWNMWMINCL